VADRAAQVDGSVDAAPGADATAATVESGRVVITVVRDGVDTSATIEDLPSLVRDEQAVLWIDLTDPSRAQVEAASAALGLHPLVAEDIGESNERAKVDHVGDIIHIVLFSLTREPRLRADEIDLVLGRRFLFSVHPGTWDPLTAHQLRPGVAPILRKGPDTLLWALSDAIVDGYFPIFDRLSDEIDELQDRVIEHPDHEVLEQIFEVKRELIRIRHVVAPSREIFNQLTSREYDLIAEPTVLYLRDIYDHLIRLTDDFDTFREMASATIEVYLSKVNNDLSTIMKRLTGVTVVLAGIGAVGGLFGMSQATPALAGGEGFGFWAITIVTVVLSIVVVAIMRRIGWV
jgi:magnesium transporter